MTEIPEIIKRFNKIMLEWIEGQWKIEREHQAGNPYTRIQFEADAHQVEEKLKALLLESVQEARDENTRKIIKELKLTRKSMKKGYGRDEYLKWEGLKKMWGEVRSVMDKFEPDIDKINRGKSRKGRKEYYKKLVDLS